MFAPVYFDHNATTPLDPSVLEAMLPWLTSSYGNASSRHEYGRAARRAIDEARNMVASALGAHATEVVFTSGGSEANNLFLKGAAASMKPEFLAVSAIEHPCVLKPSMQLVRRGWRLLTIGVDHGGRIDMNAFDEALAQRPGIISLMLANNETGVVQDVARFADRAKAAGVHFHTDAVQAFGKLPVDFRVLNAVGVHALTVSSHKIGGPKGAGALVLDKRLELEPQIAGGGHERGLRAGTENVAAIVGFAAACTLAVERLREAGFRLRALRDRLEQGVSALGATVFAANSERLPNTLYFALPNIDGETLVAQLDRAGFAVASGAACSSAHSGASHVLQAMGVDPYLARGAVRISLGAGNTEEQVEDFLVALQSTFSKLQRLTAMAV